MSAMNANWILCDERLPEDSIECLITILDREDGVSEVYKGFFQDGEWWTQWCHGCKRIIDEKCGDNIVIAWADLPKAYAIKWIDVDGKYCKCFMCGAEWSYRDNRTDMFKFCPNCGAKMEIE